NVPFITTTSSSRPSGFRPCVYPACILVALRSCISASVDLDGAALDLVDAGRPGQHVRAAQNDLAGARQRDARLTALEHDLPVGAQGEHVVVDLRGDGRRRLGAAA